MTSKIIQQAKDIAIQSLHACYGQDGIMAGTHHFTDYWARDGYFAGLGSLAIGDTTIVDKMVTAFFSLQRSDGLLPYRIMRGPISISKYLGKPSLYRNPKPTYKLRSIGKVVLDGTTLSILFAALLKRSDLIPQIKAALSYLETREKNQLLYDGPMAEWNDAVWKWGNLLYSNIIYWYVYDCLISWTRRLDQAWCQDLKRKQEIIAVALRKRLWNGKYLSDWYDYKRQDYFYPFGNCLAIAWGFTNPSETKAILRECRKHLINFSLETNAPKYPWWRVDFLQRLVGMADYQNHGILWWQPVTSYLAALKTAGDQKQTEIIAKTISEKINHDNLISECYERDGRPVKRKIYTSEGPFAWASGLIVWSLSYNTSHE